MNNGINRSGVVSKRDQDTVPEQLYPGVFKRTLWVGDSGSKALIVEIEPGARFLELDVHQPGPEIVYVLEGTFNDGVEDFDPGTYIHHPAGSSHIPQSETGCRLLVIFPEG